MSNIKFFNNIIFVICIVAINCTTKNFGNTNMQNTNNLNITKPKLNQESKSLPIFKKELRLVNEEKGDDCNTKELVLVNNFSEDSNRATYTPTLEALNNFPDTEYMIFKGNLIPKNDSSNQHSSTEMLSSTSNKTILSSNINNSTNYSQSIREPHSILSDQKSEEIEEEIEQEAADVINELMTPTKSNILRDRLRSIKINSNMKTDNPPFIPEQLDDIMEKTPKKKHKNDPQTTQIKYDDEEKTEEINEAHEQIKQIEQFAELELPNTIKLKDGILTYAVIKDVKTGQVEIREVSSTNQLDCNICKYICCFCKINFLCCKSDYKCYSCCKCLGKSYLK